MGTKRRAVISAEASQLEEIESLVDGVRYRTASELVREALAEKLDRIRRERIAEQVEHYCQAGHHHEDVDLIEAQPVAEASTPRKVRGGKRRAKR